jgi:predicted component of type VI protein secretion system
VHCKGTDYAAFFSVQTANRPKLYDKEAANANARLSAQLPYILAMSRFAHYLKAMMRDLRSRLADLRGSLQGNDKLDDALFEAVSNTATRDKLRAELGKTGGGE